MDPYYQQRLRDEMIYLHSLWHRGPPNRPFPHSPLPKRKTRDEPQFPTTCKKPLPPQPDPRWQAPEPDLPHPGWPSRPPKLNPIKPSEQEQSLLHALRLHKRALETCTGFFANAGSGSGSGSESEEDQEDGESGDVYKQWLDLFVEESELRSYYEGNWDAGEFYCLVCGGLGKTKRTKGCAALVQHALSIRKTKKKRAHRAFGQVVCRVLGWDFERSPTVVLKGERLSSYLAKTGDQKGVSGGVADNVGGERDDNAVSGEKEASNEDLMICQSEAELNAGQLDSEFKDQVASKNDATAESCEKETFDDHQCNKKDQTICQSPLKNDGTDKSREGLDEGMIEEATDASSEPEVCAGSISATTTDAGNPQLPYPVSYQEGPTKRKTRTEIELPRSNKEPLQLDPHWETPGLALNNDSASQWPPSGWSLSPVKLNLTQPSEVEQLRHQALQLHNRALEACCGFFGENAGSGSESESEEEEDDCRVGDGENNEVYKMLLNLFVEESELRSYYEGNWERSEFYCLVCGGLGKSKKIKGCVGLVHHAISISKTKKKRAHRAFAQVVCRVLGWDFERLPIVVRKGEKLSFYLVKPRDEQGEPEVNSGSCDGVAGGVKDNVGDERDANAMSGEKEASNEDLMIYQNFSKDASANQHKETLNDGISEIKEDREHAMDTRKSMKDDVTDKSREKLDEGNTLSIKEEILKEATDALENTDTHNKGILEVEANKEDGVDTGVEVVENADDCNHDLVVSKENLDTVSGRAGEIRSKEDPEVALGDGTLIARELQEKREITL